MLSLFYQDFSIKIFYWNKIFSGRAKWRGGGGRGPHQEQPGQHRGLAVAGQAGVQRQQRRQPGSSRPSRHATQIFFISSNIFVA